jgi:hypothetical protein
MAIEHSMDRALGGNADVTGEALDQELADFARAPVGALTLGSDDQAFNLEGQLVGIAPRPPRAVAQGFEPVLVVAIEDLLARLASDC